ncbi:dynamin family protein [Ornithinibacillus halophilus]|uniref:Dynamin family protein n=1 Tax=Ornithinibacillus halophilus TaxID=930117 RepID=A0A1M5CID9_9BACI|nr:dynamin family protein [Ornithinibacillus halophilus]SHF54479.1 Dynamin family protein [Ornithinibacillus halophilus]
MTVISELNKGEILKNIAAYYKIMLDNKDDVNANKMLTLYKKIQNEEFQISFSGHFSAGKSSMINALLGKDILPKSPIPTSANIVKISEGEGTARIFFKEEQPIEYSEPYDMEMIKDYCKNKDEINRIELTTSNPLLSNGGCIVDTPGIDAADDADRLMTESSLHLVDLLFYVMDYNHVQSEVNLYFLKQLQENQIPYFIIINQIDKHDESEIPFKTYVSKIKQTFEQWGLLPEEIYYSSLMNSNTPHNQFELIQQKLSSLLNNQDTNMRLDGAIKQILQDHKKYLEQTYNELLDVGEENTSVDPKDVNQLQVQIQTIKNKPKEIQQSIQEVVNTTLKNAYIMPAELRDNAESFLESQSDNFKVGIIGSKKKTLMERKERTERFINALQKSAETTVQWSLRNKLTELLKDFNITNPTVIQRFQNISVDYQDSDVQKLVKPGAKLNGDYVLNFTNDISTDIKNKYKQNIQQLLQDLIDYIKKEDQEQLSKLVSKQEKLEEQVNKQEKATSIQNELEQKLSTLDSLPKPADNVRSLIEEELQEQNKTIIKMDSSSLTFNKKEGKVEASSEDKPNESVRYNVEDVISKVDKSIQTIEELPGFQSIVNDLKDKHNRLKNRTLTIALFGAFSAGKSSFANALMGDNILPVSPNPTTAVINRINPTTIDNSHGTVVILIKNEEILVKDLKHITKIFEPKAQTFHELIQWVSTKEIYKRDELEKVYQDYLIALVKGYEEHSQSFGKEIRISIKEFSEYVTDERKACYIEAVDLYYDCSITKQGITLVDTPGADSVNARHTNVAFDYIKYADAILYVTYYNHALSRADRDFLMQLGRVKDSFQLDKMFFIVNASDLAQDQSELEMVVTYVKQQLVELGIRFPKIFSVSSKKSAKEKESNIELNQEMKIFEEELYAFIHEDLSALLAEAAMLDIKRAEKMVTNYIDTINLSLKDKENYRVDLLQKQEKLIKMLEDINATIYEGRIEEKIEKQLHYVHERLGIRFHDLFKEKFNPTTVTETGKKAKIELSHNLKSLIDYVGYELLQEVRAVSLRIESYLDDLLKEIYQELTKNVTRIDERFILPSLNDLKLSTPEYEQGLESLDMMKFDKALSLFKGTKAFFVNNEKEIMKEAIYKALSPEVKDYLSTIDQQMEDAYKNQWIELWNEHEDLFVTSINDYVDNQLSMMSNNVDVNILEDKLKILQYLLREG